MKFTPPRSDQPDPESPTLVWEALDQSLQWVEVTEENCADVIRLTEQNPMFRCWFVGLPPPRPVAPKPKPTRTPREPKEAPVIRPSETYRVPPRPDRIF